MINNVERPNHNFEQSFSSAQSYVVSAIKKEQSKVTNIADVSGKLLPDSGKNLQSKKVTPQVDLTELKNVVETINQFISNTQRSLNFSLESDTNKTIIKVVNTETDEVVRQIPSEEAIALAKALKSSSEAYVLNEQGLIIETEA